MPQRNIKDKQIKEQKEYLQANLINIGES